MKSSSKGTASKDVKELHSVLMELARLYTFRNKESICVEDISISQCYALHALNTIGPMSLNELAAYLNLEKSSASRLSHNLLEGGYIKRTSNPDDWRKISLAITKRGITTVTNINEDAMKEVMSVFRDYDSTERRASSIRTEWSSFTSLEVVLFDVDFTL